LVENRHLPHLYFARLGDVVGISIRFLGSEIQIPCAIVWCYLCDPRLVIFSELRLKTDGRTDGQTDRQTQDDSLYRPSIARAVKIVYSITRSITHSLTQLI